MNFKQEDNGTYSVTFFSAEDMPSMVRMVKHMEAWKREEREAREKAVAQAEQILENPQIDT